MTGRAFSNNLFGYCSNDVLPRNRMADQRYGFVVWDKAGAISLRVQNPVSYTAQGQVDPYPALFQGKPEYAVMDGFPWEQLQFLPHDYGRP